MRDECLLNFNNEQRVVHEHIITTMNPAYDGPKSFFLDAGGGTGKTYVLNAVIAAFRAAGINFRFPRSVKFRIVVRSRLGNSDISIH